MRAIGVDWRFAALLLLAAGVATLFLVPPAAAAPGYAEAPMRIQTKGLTAEEHVRRQVELAVSLAAELPGEALRGAVEVPLEKREIAAIDEAAPSRPLRIGLVKALARPIELGSLAPRGGTVFQTDDDRTAWAQVVRADGGGAIRLHVKDLWLPAGAELYVFARGAQAHGPYKARGPNGNGELWTTAVFGREAVLEVRVADPGDLALAYLRVPEVAVITERFARELAGREAEPRVKAPPPKPTTFCGNPSCVVDASCNNGTPADPAKLAVAKMEWIQGAFIYTCTGGLISDDNPAQDNFFLTANHCISKSNSAQNVSLYWRFATTSCNGTCPSNSGWPYVTTGATVSATGRKADFTLLRLGAAPPSGSVFLGWTSAPVANTNGADLYRISNPGFGPQVFSQHDVDTAAGTCRSWPRGERIYSRDVVGAIDGGSSGSPVVNGSSQIVGQLSGTCGTNPSDPCASGPGEANATVDGAFAFYFSIVQPILDP